MAGLDADGQPGLHICANRVASHIERKWTPIRPKPRTCIVNIGTELERWSNGRFKATLHAVLGAAFFAGGHGNTGGGSSTNPKLSSYTPEGASLTVH